MPKLDPVRRVGDAQPIEPYPCEHCDALREHGYHQSFIVGLNVYSRTKGYTYKQCDEGAGQHFACSHAHAVALVEKCLSLHDPSRNMPPFFYNPCAFSTCAICKRDIGDTGYRYTLTYAMPGRDQQGRPYNPYLCIDEHWCCCLDHAREAALACLEEHLEDEPHG